MSDNKKLLIDCLPFEVSPSLVTESMEENNGRVVVQGVIQRANALNQNKRIYPKHILEREVDRYRDLVKERRSLGELDHPDSSVVNLANTSHLVSDLWWDGDDLMAKIEVLPTPSGNILKQLFAAGVKIGISSRGLGTTREIGQGKVEVQDDYEILCWDMVSNPSTQGSFVSPINESVDRSKNTKNHMYSEINNIIIEIFSALKYECGKKCEIPD